MSERLRLLALLALAIAGGAAAEPYIAVDRGLPCAACHTQPGGGGMRNAYGNVFSQTEMPSRRIGSGDEHWTGEITRWFSVGANLRSRYEYIDQPNAESTSSFDVSRATLYLQANLVPDRLALYVDQQLAPGGSLNREAYARYVSASGKFSVMAGQFYLPYGLRLQDDSAFVRQVTGINFTNPDRGVQVGYVSGAWTTLVSLTNGAGGGAELDTGKQLSLVSTFVRDGWRLGLSANVNDADAGDRNMAGAFAGLRTGPIAWLAEVNWIRDDLPTEPARDSIVSLIEANWRVSKGHNLKLSHDWFDPDDAIDEDDQARWSLLWEYTPIQFLQTRIGVRVYDGIPQVDAQNRDVVFVELHAFF